MPGSSALAPGVGVAGAAGIPLFAGRAGAAAGNSSEARYSALAAMFTVRARSAALKKKDTTP